MNGHELAWQPRAAMNSNVGRVDRVVRIDTRRRRDTPGAAHPSICGSRLGQQEVNHDPSCGALIIIEPKILAWLLASGSVFLGIMLLLMAGSIRGMGAQARE